MTYEPTTTTTDSGADVAGALITELPDSGNLNTGSRGSLPGAFGLGPTQRYECPEGYVLTFEGGNPVCKSTKTDGGPGGRQDVPPKVIDISEGQG